MRVARIREPGVTLEQIAADLGVHPITLPKWLRRADTDEDARPAGGRAGAAGPWAYRKRTSRVRVRCSAMWRPGPSAPCSSAEPRNSPRSPMRSPAPPRASRRRC
ncbi:hypothetical protein [Streptomyces sp. NBC_00654]|uniref:hypothetical protein n=1 Tax=Streptomyces sp. NBC_00654 TaxID=2975799 RepID=UPI0022538BF4|nr:hypothetical protein [Streptomyces sp. NBC_00654]